MVDLLKRQMPFAVAKICRARGAGLIRLPSHPHPNQTDLIMTSSTNPALAEWALDHEIVLSQVVGARRDVVFSAWAEPEHLPNAFLGPRPVSRSRTKKIDIRIRRLSHLDMISPDGPHYPNRMQFRRIEPPDPDRNLIQERIDADDPERFRTTITYNEQSNKQDCDYPVRQLHPTEAQRDAKIGFGAVEYGCRITSKALAPCRMHCVHKACAAVSVPAAVRTKPETMKFIQEAGILSSNDERLLYPCAFNRSVQHHLQSIGWRFEAQGLSRTLIEPQGNRVEIALGDAREVGSSREVLTQQAVGVLV